MSIVDKLKPFKKKLINLMIVSFIVAFFGGRDAILSTRLYNSLDLNKPIKFLIIDKKQNGRFFPDFQFVGKTLETNGKKIIQVSSGDFDRHEIGQIIHVFQSESSHVMTDYEIDNQCIIFFRKIGFFFFFNS
jgi:hypothetical protein